MFDDFLKWIIENNYFIWLGISVIFFSVLANQNNCQRFVQLLFDTISILGKMLLDCSNSLLGILSTVEDFFETLTYVLFGNFSSGIRFIMANYVILFASVVSFLTTFWGLCEIVNFVLALVLSFAIQTALVLMCLYFAQQILGESVRWTRGREYYLGPEFSVPGVLFAPIVYKPQIPSIAGQKATFGHILCRGFRILAIIAVTGLLVIISSMLTYVFLYASKLDDYMVFQIAYDVMDKVEEDTAKNRKKLEEDSNRGMALLHSFWEKVGVEQGSGDSLNEFILYLEEPFKENDADEMKPGDERLQDFTEYLKSLDSDKKQKLFGGNYLDNDSENNKNEWDGSHIASVKLETIEDMQYLAENMIQLKNYNADDLGRIEDEIGALRDCLPTSASESDTDFTEEKKWTIQKNIQNLISKEKELYKAIPTLNKIRVLVPSDNTGMDESENTYKLCIWSPSVEREFVYGYNQYQEITDTQLMLAGRAFRAIWYEKNNILKYMLGFSFITDLIIVITCFVRTKQVAGTNRRIKRELIRSIFIRDKRNGADDMQVVEHFIGLVGIVLLAITIMLMIYEKIETKQGIVIAVLECAFGMIVKMLILSIINNGREENEQGEEEKKIDQIFTECGLNILNGSECKRMLRENYILWLEPDNIDKKWMKLPINCRSTIMEKRQETTRCQEFYLTCDYIKEKNFEKEIVLLCNEELAYPVMDQRKEHIGYMITKECIHILIKEIFDAARMGGLNIQMFKEDVREYEEDIWS